ncbi:phage virion morphogenesis protein [Lysobacter arvi]|uniref:Phage virion morphogenesis protein n=1 Tax=Lysobacter arvi TaxID=3038776 RepID=A0ABU1CE16_9GAMM|nr:phage virion morphogenesis protein [Lysobacter arvi]MDR0182405.1 phage virion morphogenesis protein [Lysobacter arvi]
MTDELDRLESWAGALLARVAPTQRRQLALRIARDVRTDQQRRIAEQRNPDGSPFAPRSARFRDKSGRIRRRAMFAKLRTSKHLKARADANVAEVGFTGRTSRLASVHQYGGSDRMSRTGPRVRYPARRLLGLAPDSTECIREMILRHISEN